MPSYFKIGTLGNEEILGRSQSWVEASPREKQILKLF